MRVDRRYGSLCGRFLKDNFPVFDELLDSRVVPEFSNIVLDHRQGFDSEVTGLWRVVNVCVVHSRPSTHARHEGLPSSPHETCTPMRNHGAANEIRGQ